MSNDDSKKSLIEQYTELSKNSLIKVQFSCCGNFTNIDEPGYIPIVADSYMSENSVNYTMANEENVEAIVKLLKTNDLPVSDLITGQRIFLVALSDGKTVGCVAIENYGDAGILRSLAVNNDYRGKGIGQKLVAEAESWSRENGIKNLYLLTITAAGFFPKMGWENTERTSVPESVGESSEFASICPSIAVCMYKKIN